MTRWIGFSLLERCHSIAGRIERTRSLLFVESFAMKRSKITDSSKYCLPDMR